MNKLKKDDVVHICPLGHGNVSLEPFRCMGPHANIPHIGVYWGVNSVEAIVSHVPETGEDDDDSQTEEAG